jgi:hypothetical protein
MAAASFLNRVSALFPERQFSIAKLAGRDRAFDALCEEYGLAIEALEVLHAQKSHSISEIARIAEYRVLVEELKDDLEHQLLAATRADP